ncbi:MAG: hypothetical protein GY884_16455, partial [Proteobacteria bacterium]|nr:hypothetical protein [Pseudomonadota bacterium]
MHVLVLLAACSDTTPLPDAAPEARRGAVDIDGRSSDSALLERSAPIGRLQWGDGARGLAGEGWCSVTLMA